MMDQASEDTYTSILIVGDDSQKELTKLFISSGYKIQRKYQSIRTQTDATLGKSFSKQKRI